MRDRESNISAQLEQLHDDELQNDLMVALQNSGQAHDWIQHAIIPMAKSLKKRMILEGAPEESFERVLQVTQEMMRYRVDLPRPFPYLKKQLRQALTAELMRLAFDPENSETVQVARKSRRHELIEEGTREGTMRVINPNLLNEL